MLSFPISAVLVVLSPEVVFVRLGPQWDAVVIPFRMLALAIAFRVGHKVCQAVVQAKGAVYNLAWRQGAYVGAVFLGAWTGKAWGLTGVAIVVLLAILLNYVLMLILCVKLVELDWRGMARIHLRHFCISLFLGGSGWLLADVLRSQGIHPAWILIGVTSFLMLLMGGLALGMKGIFGDEGDLVARQIRKKLGLSKANSPLAK
jgi:PST family polysaccharide transporter